MVVVVAVAALVVAVVQLVAVAVVVLVVVVVDGVFDDGIGVTVLARARMMMKETPVPFA